MSDQLLKCSNKECVLFNTIMLQQPDNPIMRCPVCGYPMKVVTNQKKAEAHWLEEIAADKSYWLSDAEKLFPSVIAHEYSMLRKYCRQKEPYAVLLSLKDNFESLLKLEVLLAYAWGAHLNDEQFVSSTISLLTTPNLSMGAWLELASILIKRLRETGEKLPEVIPLEQLRKSYARFEVVNWRNTLIGHGAMGMDDSEEFREEIKNKLRALNSIFEKLGEKIRQQELYFFCKDAAFGEDTVSKEPIVLIGSDMARGLPGYGEIRFRSKDRAQDYSVEPFITLRKHKNEGYGIYFFDNQRTSFLSRFLNYVKGHHSSEEVTYFRQLRKQLDLGNVKLEAVADNPYLTEEELRQLDLIQMSHKYVKQSHLMLWLKGCVDQYDQGVFYLKMERGTGKSAFSEKLNCLYEKPERIADDLDVRTYHFSRAQSSGTSDFCNMVEWQWSNQFEGRNWARAPRIVDYLNKGMSPSKALCAFMNSIQEYSKRTRGKKRLLMVLDGLDEIIDESLWEYIPALDDLGKGIYILLTSRNPETESLPEQISRHLRNLSVTEEFCIARKGNENINFLNVYLQKSSRVRINDSQADKLKELADYRVLYLGLLCRLLEYGMKIEDLPDREKAAATYLKTLEGGYNEKESVLIREMIAVLCTLGTYEPLTINTLCTIFREEGVSLRIIGMLRDLAPLLKIDRGETGNGYMVANLDIAREMAEQIPETEDVVRGIVRLTISVLKDALIIGASGKADTSFLYEHADKDEGAKGFLKRLSAYRTSAIREDIFESEPGLDVIAAHITEIAVRYLPEGADAMGNQAVLLLGALTESTSSNTPKKRKRRLQYSIQTYLCNRLLYGVDNTGSTDALYKVGLCYKDQGLYHEATDAFDEVLEVLKENPLYEIFGKTRALDVKRQLASTMGILGAWNRALDMLTEMLNKCKEKFGEDHIDTLRVRAQRANLLYEMGYPIDAYDELMDVYGKQLLCLAKDDPEIVNTLCDAIDAYITFENPEPTLKVLEEQYDTQMLLWGEQGAGTQCAMQELAKVYLALGRYEQAKDFLEKIYDSKVKTHGNNHPETLIAEANLAFSLGSLGNMEKALQLQKEVFDKDRALLGADFLETLRSQQNLAVMLANAEDNDAAISMQEEVYRKSAASLGQAHPFTAESAIALAGVYDTLGYDQRAKDLLQDIYLKFKDIYGEYNHITLRIKFSLAEKLFGRHQIEKASQMFGEIYDVQKMLLGDVHPETQATLQYLQLLQVWEKPQTSDKTLVQWKDIIDSVNQSQYDEALSLIQGAQEEIKNLFGKESKEAVISVFAKAFVLSGLGRYEEALEAYKEAFRKNRSAENDNNIEMILSYRIAFTLGDLERYAESLDVYRKVYEKMSRMWGKKHLYTLAALNDIAFTLGKLGRFKEAIDRQQELISIRTEVFGHDSYETLSGKVRLAELYRWAGERSAEQKIVESLLEQLTELGHTDLIERLERK